MHITHGSAGVDIYRIEGINISGEDSSRSITVSAVANFHAQASKGIHLFHVPVNIKNSWIITQKCSTKNGTNIDTKLDGRRECLNSSSHHL